MTRIGRYRLDRVLGTGAFATVWSGYDEELEISVAVKVLADNWARNADVRERFLSEARLMRRIDSDRVVRVHDVGTTDDDLPYFVMDLVTGGTVADLREPGEALPPEDVGRLVVDIAAAVQALHEHGVLHRDIKPSNLLLRRGMPDPFVVVTDLGTAKLAAEASALTMATGTPAYMAPELAYGTGGFDARADVYALGVVASELLAGSRPFEVKDVAEILGREPGPATVEVAARSGLPTQVDELLQHTLSTDPEARPATAEEFGARFSAALAGDADSVQGLGRLPDTDVEGSAGEVAPRRTQGWSLPMTVAVAVLLLLLAAALGWWLA